MDYREYLFKCVLLGDSGVGKSSLSLRFTDDVFSEQNISTIGVYFSVRTFELDGSKIKIQVESFDNIERWKDSVDKHGNSDAVLYLVGNKADLEAKRVIDFERGQDLSKRLGISFVETSAKDKTNIEQAFVGMAAEIKEKLRTTIEQNTCMPGLKLNSTELTHNNGTCKC